MARLDGDDGRFLLVEPIRYYREDISCPPDAGQVIGEWVDRCGNRVPLVRWTPNDFEANLVVARLAACNGVHTWDAIDEGGSVSTFDLVSLVEWFHALADGRPALPVTRQWTSFDCGDETAYWSSEDDNLEFAATSRAGRLHLALTVGGWALFSDEQAGLRPSGDDFYTIPFAPTPELLRGFADALAQESVRLPVRVVEPNGHARTYLDRIARNQGDPH